MIRILDLGLVPLAKQMQEALAPHVLLWDEFTLRQDMAGSPHHDTKCIPLYSPHFIADAFKLGVHRGRTRYAEAMPDFMKLVNVILSGMNVTEIGNVMLTKLLPGGEIDRHPDEGDYANYYTRVHFVIDNPLTEAWFETEGDVEKPPTGTLFTFNNLRPHSAGNPSYDGRVHLILDLTITE